MSRPPGLCRFRHISMSQGVRGFSSDALSNRCTAATIIAAASDPYLLMNNDAEVEDCFVVIDKGYESQLR